MLTQSQISDFRKNGFIVIDAAVSLLGDDVCFHHDRVNSKLPGVATTVKWHQDFTFDPHSNDDCIFHDLYSILDSRLFKYGN